MNKEILNSKFTEYEYSMNLLHCWFRLQRENKIRTAENQSLKAQVEGLEEDLHKVQMQGDSSKREAEDVLRQLQVSVVVGKILNTKYIQQMKMCWILWLKRQN